MDPSYQIEVVAAMQHAKHSLVRLMNMAKYSYLNNIYIYEGHI